MTREEREAADEAVNVLYTFVIRHTDSAPYTVRQISLSMSQARALVKLLQEVRDGEA